MQPTEQLVCAFCGRSSTENQLIVGPVANICVPCLESSAEVLRERGVYPPPASPKHEHTRSCPVCMNSLDRAEHRRCAEQLAAFFATAEASVLRGIWRGLESEWPRIHANFAASAADARAHADLGLAYLEMGLRQEAMVEAQRALAGKPDRDTYATIIRTVSPTPDVVQRLHDAISRHPAR